MRLDIMQKKMCKKSQFTYKNKKLWEKALV